MSSIAKEKVAMKKIRILRAVRINRSEMVYPSDAYNEDDKIRLINDDINTTLIVRPPYDYFKKVMDKFADRFEEFLTYYNTTKKILFRAVRFCGKSYLHPYSIMLDPIFIKFCEYYHSHADKPLNVYVEGGPMLKLAKNYPKYNLMAHAKIILQDIRELVLILKEKKVEVKVFLLNAREYFALAGTRLSACSYNTELIADRNYMLAEFLSSGYYNLVFNNKEEYESCHEIHDIIPKDTVYYKY